MRLLDQHKRRTIAKDIATKEKKWFVVLAQKLLCLLTTKIVEEKWLILNSIF